ncbi:DUF3492 domain-containing protein [Gracilimonas mengyeensis]|uniref:Glycosyltransferase involved in cell wall bisynthesis n=1 Tax=Gracilimonas mengyeensis TaxID=1302730 RepID=A0A521AIF8_9BACT|nr:DUF3492 domain-containing protein [Gracilimonas mengyeensis]SMO34538.1 Glycosyltransferase involved in cell wall bisynthesis [Gracilimonas mengyeensis]
MRVLLIIEGTYPWYRGGVSEWVYQYLAHLPDVKFTILQLATDEFQHLDPEDALYPITRNIDTFRRIFPPDANSQLDQYLERWYQQNKYQFKSLIPAQDVVHVTNTGFAGWLGSRLAENYKLPLLLTEHAIYWKEVELGAVALECGYEIPQTEEAKMRISRSFKKMAEYTYQSADQIISVSQSNIPYQKGLGADNIQYIPNGIPEDWLMHSKNRGEQPVIGWVGRCAEMKNPLAFFELVEAFKKQNCTPVFRMLLSDANEKELEEEVRQKAQEFPEVDMVWNQPAKDYFKDFDFLVISSHNESQPLVMLEAIAHRALPVGFQVGDLNSEYGMILDSKVGFGPMAEQIVQLWNDEKKFEDTVAQSFKKIREEHTWPQIFESYKSVIQQIIA